MDPVDPDLAPDPEHYIWIALMVPVVANSSRLSAYKSLATVSARDGLGNLVALSVEVSVYFPKAETLIYNISFNTVFCFNPEDIMIIECTVADQHPHKFFTQIRNYNKLKSWIRICINVTA